MNQEMFLSLLVEEMEFNQDDDAEIARIVNSFIFSDEGLFDADEESND